MPLGWLAKRSFATPRRCGAASIAVTVLLSSGAAQAAAPTTTYRSDVLAASPVSFWRLGDASGSTAADELNANPATSSNVSLNQAGALTCDANSSTGFNGSSSYVAAPSSSSLNMTSAATVEFWAKRTSISSTWQVLVGKPGDGQSQNENYAVWMNASNKYEAYFGNGSTYVTVVSTAVTDTNWHYVVATTDGSTASIYLDGVLKQSTPMTVKLTANAQPLNIGRANSGQFFFSGLIDEVALYPTALSATTIQAHYSKATSDLVPPCLSLTAPANGTTSTTSNVGFSGTGGTSVGDSSSVTINVYAGTSTTGTPAQAFNAMVGAGGAYTVSANLPDGTWTAQAQQQNGAGMTGYTAATTFSVSTQGPPAPTITSSPPNPSQSASASFGFSDTAAGVTFRCSLDGGAYVACSSPVSYAGLTDGTHSFAVQVVDASGTPSPPTSYGWTVDTTAPNVTLVSPAHGDNRAEWPTFSGVAGTATGDSATVTVTLYAGSTPSGTALQTLSARAGSGGVYSVIAAAPLNPGTYTAQAQQTDAVGNSGASWANTFTVGDPVILAAGSIASCSDSGASRTAALLSTVPDALVMPLGNNAYENGQPSEYQNCYDPTWGLAKTRTRPAIGQHDDQTVPGGAPAGTGYANYFASQLTPLGAAADDPTKLYYSYDLGAWHVVVLNDSCIDATTPNCDETAQESWLRNDLTAHSSTQCTLAVWNRPRWSSDSQVGDRIFIGRFWNILYQYGVDLVLNGATHHYERFAPQDPDGNVDNTYGIREILSAHGGYSSNTAGVRDANSLVYDDTSYGVLAVTLHSAGYDWKFLPVADGLTPAGGSFTDSGSSSCHGAPPPQTLSYHDQVMSASPAGYWRLGDTSGPTAADELGADPGTYSHVTLNQPGALTGDANPSASFDGSSSYVTVPDSSALDLTRGATVEFWAKRRSAGSDYEVLVGKPGDGLSQNENYAVWQTPSNDYIAYFGDGTDYVSVATPAVTDSNWHYIVATDDGATAKIYLDGVLEQEASATLKLTANPQPLNIGRASSNQFFFNGWIDEVAIYPTALPGTTVYNHYTTALSPPAASSVPTPTVTSGPASPSASSSASFSFTDSQGGVGFQCSLDGGTSGVCASPQSYSGLADGSHVFQVTAVDAAGNTSAPARYTWTVDTTPPALSLSSPAPSDTSNTPIAASSIASTLSGAATGSGGTITFTVFGPQATAPSACASGGTTVGSATVNGSGTYRSSGGFTPSQPGTYWWYASYSGDANNGASNSGCGPAMPATYVYSLTSAASATDTTAHNFTRTSSFTVAPSTTYLLLVFRHSPSGDGITSIASTGLTPALSTASFASVTAQTYNTSDHQWVYWVTTAGSAGGTGTLTVTFAKTLAGGQVTILDLIKLAGTNTSNPVALANVGKATASSNTAAAKLPTTPSPQDAGLAFLSANGDLGASSPIPSPAMIATFYSHQGAGSTGIYTATPAQGSEAFAIKSQPWGTVALEINHP